MQWGVLRTLARVVNGRDTTTGPHAAATASYAKALLAATRQGDLVKADQPKKIAGMTAEQIAIALKPFGQVQSSRSRNHEGTGLGLPIAKALIEQHGGTFSITSAENTGTTVTLTLPETDIALNQTIKERKPWAL